MVNLPITDDIFIECNESVILTIFDQSVGTLNAETASANIIDDECAQATISIESFSDGGEPSSSPTLVISFENGLINGTGSFVTGTLDLSGGTAIPGLDFTDVAIFQIVNGANSTVININVIDNFTSEPTETIVATISNPTTGVIGIDTATANITDNDGTSGIDPIDFSRLSIYPNPVNSTLNIEADQQISSYVIRDLNGRVIRYDLLKAKSASIDVEFLPTGFYLIETLMEDGTKVSKKILKA